MEDKKVPGEEKKVFTIDEVEREVKLIEAKTKTAKEQASRLISKWGMPTLLILVTLGILSSLLLTTEALPAVIGLVSTVSMATIQMLQGITGTKDESEKAQADLMRRLVDKQNESGNGGTAVKVGKGGVSVSSNGTSIETEAPEK
jgi:hypothetical protein